MRYRNQRVDFVILAAIGERGVMNKKLLGFALVFSLLGGFLAACEPQQDTAPGGGGTAPGGGGTAPAEPSPAVTPSP